jgi:hypothetical protein
LLLMLLMLLMLLAPLVDPLISLSIRRIAVVRRRFVRTGAGAIVLTITSTTQIWIFSFDFIHFVITPSSSTSRV